MHKPTGLRQALQQITEDRSGWPHRERVEALKSEFEHSISWISGARDGPNGYNCFMYALGMQIISVTVWRLGQRDVFPDSVFALHVVETACDRVQAEDVREGDMVLYVTGDMLKHAGIVQENGRIRSKWALENCGNTRSSKYPSLTMNKFSIGGFVRLLET